MCSAMYTNCTVNLLRDQSKKFVYVHIFCSVEARTRWPSTWLCSTFRHSSLPGGSSSGPTIHYSSSCRLVLWFHRSFLLSARPFIHSSSRPTSVLRSAQHTLNSVRSSCPLFSHPFVHLFCNLFVHWLLNRLYSFSILTITCTASSVLYHISFCFIQVPRTMLLIGLLMTQVQASGIWRKWKRKFRPGNPEGSPLHTSNSGTLILECIFCLNGFLSQNTVEDG